MTKPAIFITIVLLTLWGLWGVGVIFIITMCGLALRHLGLL